MNQTMIYADKFYVLTDIKGRSTIFEGLYYRQELLTLEWTELVDFVEFFQAYLKNHLQMTQTYRWGEELTFSLVKQDGMVQLNVTFAYENLTFSKLEAAQLVHKVNRVLARCDLLYLS